MIVRNVFQLLSLCLLYSASACSGPVGQGSVPRAVVTGPCSTLAPPAPGQTPGLEQYTGGPGKAVRVPMPDLDGDGRADLLVQGKGYTSATGNVAANLYLRRGACGRYVGSLWTSGDGPQVKAGRHHGLPVLQAHTHMSFKEYQTRYCFDGDVYVPMAERVRHFYDHRRKRLRNVLNESHWEPWTAQADSACRPPVQSDRTQRKPMRTVP